MRTPPVLSVFQLNTYVKSLLDADEHLANVFVSGEISNFTHQYKSGHFYLSLKDDRGVIKAVMFAPQARRVRFMPQDGMQVIVRGRVSVYEQTGQYQLYIEDMQPDGAGALNFAFEQMKQRLQDEGLFDSSRKKDIPRMPERVGVITSPTGAVYHDIVTILARRFPLATVVFAPVQVQGEIAPLQICEAIERMNRLHAADVLIVARGGGSIEELWAFNDEKLARVVACSRIPVISAVGHETDFTICDFAADLRAPTPSAAAELAVPNQAELHSYISGYASAVRKNAINMVERYSRLLSRLQSSRALSDPLAIIENKKKVLDMNVQRMKNSSVMKVQNENKHLASLCTNLDLLSPMKVLARGYAVAFSEHNEIVRSVKHLRPNQHIFLLLADGRANCIVQPEKDGFYEADEL